MSHPVILVDALTGRPLEVDRVDHALAIIDYVHHSIHEGEHFTFSYVDTDFDIADTLALLITTGDKVPHMVIDCETSKDTTVTLYEGVTHTELADIGTTVCNNRHKPQINTTRMTTRNVDGSDGRSIWTTYFGVSATPVNVRVAGARSENEFMLKPNSKYQLVIATGTDNSYLSLHIYWYEEDIKEEAH